MKITTVVPFPSQSAASVPQRLGAGSEPSDPVELTAKLAAERQRIAEDLEALQLRESNLREYEARLRAMQSEMDNQRGGVPRTTSPFLSRSAAPFLGDPGLDAAWQKLHRARELCEAEQAHLRDDRMAMHAFELDLKRREEAVAAREAQVAGQEEGLAAGIPPVPRVQPTPAAETSAFKRFTRAPFLMAESVLRGKSAKSPEQSGK